MGYRLNRLDEPVFMAVSKLLLTELGIHHRLESCDRHIRIFPTQNHVTSQQIFDQLFWNLLKTLNLFLFSVASSTNDTTAELHEGKWLGAVMMV